MKKVIKTVSLLVACTPVLIGCGGKSEVTLPLIDLSHITAADFDLIANSLFCTPYK